MFPFMSRFGMAVSYVPWAWVSVLANSEGCYVPDWFGCGTEESGPEAKQEGTDKRLITRWDQEPFYTDTGETGSCSINVSTTLWTISKMCLHQCVYFNNWLLFSIRRDLDSSDQESFSSPPKRLLVLWSALLFWLTGWGGSLCQSLATSWSTHLN